MSPRKPATRPGKRQLRQGADQASRIGRRDQTRKLLERLARQQAEKDDTR